LSHEHTNFLWLDLNRAKEQLTFDQEKVILVEAGQYVAEIGLV